MVSFGLVKVTAIVLGVSLSKLCEKKKFGFSIAKKTKTNFFSLNQILRTNYGILITKNVCFRLNRVRGIRIRNWILKIPSSFCAMAASNIRKKIIFCKK